MIQRLQPDQDVFMADDFLDHDTDTPTEADLDQAYGSKFLSAADVGDRKIRTKITKVRKADVRILDADPHGACARHPVDWPAA